MPTIDSVMVAEAAAPKSGVLESNEKLIVTWAASSSNGIARQSVTVDGKAIPTIYGPYGKFYSSPIGIYSAGTHQYVIAATDMKGVTCSYTGTFTVAPGPVTPPVVSSVVVSPSTITSGNSVTITWAATKDAVSQSVIVDGRRFTTIGGPYTNKWYYLCSVGVWSGGTHAYSITATNKSGISSTYSSTFDVTATLVPPLVIGGVVVAEDAAPRDGTLDPTEMLVMTWGASARIGGITSQTITIDGRTVSPAGGTSGGPYYCVIGAWSAGTHTYVITATSSSMGGGFNFSGTFTVAASSADLLAAVVEEDDSTSSDSLDLLSAALPLGNRSLLGGRPAPNAFQPSAADKTDALDLVFAAMGGDGKRA